MFLLYVPMKKFNYKLGIVKQIVNDTINNKSDVNMVPPCLRISFLVLLLQVLVLCSAHSAWSCSAPQHYHMVPGLICSSMSCALCPCSLYECLLMCFFREEPAFVPAKHLLCLLSYSLRISRLTASNAHLSA